MIKTRFPRARPDAQRGNRVVVSALLFLAVLVQLAACNQQTPQAGSPRPNIVFILADDMGYAIPGSYGGQFVHTPNIDQLAREGMRFAQAYAGNPVCGPSRAALLLGKHNGITSLRGNTGGWRDG